MSRAEPVPTYVLGIDVGGTKIAGGVVEFPSGRVVTRRVIATRPEQGGPAVFNTTATLAQSLLDEARTQSIEVLGLGVGVCELVDLNGQVTSSHRVAWRGLPIQSGLSRFGPTVLESDVRAAALGEAVCGTGRNLDWFVYVTVGTGISSCLVLGGRPLAGVHGNALVLASSPLTSVCTNCGARAQPVLEDIAAGPALVRRYNDIYPNTIERGEDVMAAAMRGDSAAADVVRTAGEALGVSVGWLVNVTDPEAVVVGGGLGLAGGLYWSSFVEATRRHIWSATTRDLPVLPAALGSEAGLIGAAATAWRRFRPA